MRVRRVRPLVVVLGSTALVVALVAALAIGTDGDPEDRDAARERVPPAGAPSLARGAALLGAGAPRRSGTRVHGGVRGTDGAPRSGVAVFLHVAREGDAGARAYFAPDVARSAARTRLGLAGDREPPPPAWAERRALRTDAAGDYAFDEVPAGALVEVVVRAPDAETASAKVAVVESEDGGPPRDVRRDFVLATRPEVRLRLVDEDGVPVEGAAVALYVRAAHAEGAVAPFGWAIGEGGDGEPPSACEVVRPRAGGESTVTVRVVLRTDADGVARGRPVQRGAWRVAAHAAGFHAFVADGTSFVEGEAAARLDLGEVVLRKTSGASPRARLVGPDAAPLRGRVVALTTADEFQSEVPGADPDALRRTDEHGWFPLDAVDAGREHHVWVHPTSPGGRPRRVRARLVPGAVVVVPETDATRER
jgi:hypothetical protein